MKNNARYTFEMCARNVFLETNTPIYKSILLNPIFVKWAVTEFIGLTPERTGEYQCSSY
jgi:hypothetical protein